MDPHHWIYQYPHGFYIHDWMLIPAGKTCIILQDAGCYSFCSERCWQMNSFPSLLFFLYWHTQLILFCLLLSSTLCFSSSFPIPLLLSCVIFLPLTELLPLSSHFKTEWFLTWAKKICWWQYSWTVAGLGVNRKSLYSLVSQVALEPALLYKGSTSILAAHKNTAKQRRKGWDSTPVLPEFKVVPVIHFSVRKLSPQI